MNCKEGKQLGFPSSSIESLIPELELLTTKMTDWQSEWEVNLEGAHKLWRMKVSHRQFSRSMFK